MNYKPLIVIDDDNLEQLKLFRYKSMDSGVDVEIFESWDLAKEFIETNLDKVDGIILDARGKVTIDKGASDAHIFQSYAFVQGIGVPFAIYTAHTAELHILEEEIANGRVFTKGTHKEEDVYEYLKNEITKTPKLKIIKKYPEPFQCFGGKYLDKRYEGLLLKIIKIFEDDSIDNPEEILFNPCRTILEQIFKKITETNEEILPYALIDFERQRAPLSNCCNYLSGRKYYLNGTKSYSTNFFKDSGYERISDQIYLMIGICHPASHEIQNSYSTYTFKSVLWAMFDVLIWLKAFVDKQS